jgi:hypothetical protein
MAKATREQSAAAVKSTSQAEIGGDIPNEVIAQLAYQKYCERGYEEGHDLEDWLAAENELRRAHAQPD